MKVFRILLQCVPNHYRIGSEFNKGDAAVIISTIATLKRVIPEAEFVSLIQLSDSFATQYGVKVVKTKNSISKDSNPRKFEAWMLFSRVVLWAILRKYFHLDWNILLNNALLKEYREADVIIDLSLDLFDVSTLEISRDILIEVLLGKPVVIYAQTIRPFKKLTLWLAKQALSRASLITVREELSQKYLDRLGINQPPIYVTADPAFLLEPAQQSKTNEKITSFKISPARSLIGVTVPHVGELWGASKDWRGPKRLMLSAYNFLAYVLPDRVFSKLMGMIRKTGYFRNLKLQYKSKIIGSIARLVDSLVERMGALVLLIPTFWKPQWYSPPTEDENYDIEDDISIAHEVHRLVSHKKEVILIKGEYSAEEIKGIIGQCDLFISLGKFHPYVFATSQCVPSILVGSDQKLRGVAAMLQQEKWLCDTFSVDEVIAKAEAAWAQRRYLRQDLKVKMEDICQRAFLNAQLVKDLLISHIKKSST